MGARPRGGRRCCGVGHSAPSRAWSDPLEIINILREAEVLMSQGRRTGEVCGGLDISESYCQKLCMG